MHETRKSFRLTGQSVALDLRVNAVRPDLADVALADRLFAPHYAQAIARSCVAPHTKIYDRPGGAQTSELLQGETFMLLDVSGGSAWGYCAHDHYVGYLDPEALGAMVPPPKDSCDDAISSARRFIGMRYVFGGRGGDGIDCSGLVQRALASIGVAAPRDSDMQENAVGRLLDDSATLAGGDLVFFPGHVAMMIDDQHLIHATGVKGEVVIEPLSEVVARIAENYDRPILARKRVLG
jgi:cell wall-associated NlpC family hydrolase